MRSIAYAIVVFSGAILLAAAQFSPGNTDGPHFGGIAGGITMACGFALLLRDKRE